MGYAMGERMTKNLVSQSLFRAVTAKRPAAGLIHHSDHGNQYCAAGYRKLLARFKMRASMSRRGNCYDNAPITLRREKSGKAPGKTVRVGKPDRPEQPRHPLFSLVPHVLGDHICPDLAKTGLLQPAIVFLRSMSSTTSSMDDAPETSGLSCGRPEYRLGDNDLFAVERSRRRSIKIISKSEHLAYSMTKQDVIRPR